MDIKHYLNSYDKGLLYDKEMYDDIKTAFPETENIHFTLHNDNNNGYIVGTFYDQDKDAVAVFVQANIADDEPVRLLLDEYNKALKDDKDTPLLYLVCAEEEPSTLLLDNDIKVKKISYKNVETY